MEKEVFADVIRLRISRRDHPGICWWLPDPITSVGVRDKQKQTDTQGAEEKGHVRMEAELGVTQPQPRNTWGHQNLEEAGRILHWRLWRELGPPDTLHSDFWSAAL